MFYRFITPIYCYYEYRYELLMHRWPIHKRLDWCKLCVNTGASVYSVGRWTVWLTNSVPIAGDIWLVQPYLYAQIFVVNSYLDGSIFLQCFSPQDPLESNPCFLLNSRNHTKLSRVKIGEKTVLQNFLNFYATMLFRIMEMSRESILLLVLTDLSESGEPASDLYTKH
jgi:hypothetical protein